MVAVMLSIFRALVIFVILFPSAISADEECLKKYEFVNPFIGSSGFGWGYGGVSPASQVPYGALRLGPDTESLDIDAFFRHDSGYNYRDTIVRAFSHTRVVGAGVADYGNFGIIGIRSNNSAGSYVPPRSWYSRMDKKTEQARPGRYEVHFEEQAMKARIMQSDTHSYICACSHTQSPNQSTNQSITHLLIHPHTRPTMLTMHTHSHTVRLK